MDQIKIGKFIAERRKNVNLTQMQLAEKLNITDRAVSKWETGLAMPDPSIMLELCAILDITADELLRGEGHKKRTVEETEWERLQKTYRKMFWALKSIPLICGLLALLFSFFFNGAQGKIYEVGRFEGYEYICIKLIGFVFGGGAIYSPNGKKLDELNAFSGISLFGVIAFLCLIAAVVLFIIYILKKKGKLYVASCVLFILSGIFILFLLWAGTTFNGTGWGGWAYKYIQTQDDIILRLGAGTILWSLLCVLGGAFGLYHHFLSKSKNKIMKKR